MPEIKKYSLIERLQNADKEFDHKTSVVGMSSLTFPGYINSTRTQMFTSHLKQFLNIVNPQFPYVFSGAENTVGKHSTGYKKAKHDLTVIKKIAKYDDIVENPYFYYLFVYDEKKKRYDVLERKELESLTEDFAFEYNNDYIDGLEEGDLIPEGEVLYKSTSYDDTMNYRYGRNATVIYVLDPWTSEDAAVISESFSKAMGARKSKEFIIGINPNEIPLNMYGDSENYKPFPDIGEYCNSVVSVVRPMRKDQMYYDLMDENLGIIKDGDRVYYSGGKGVQIIDYDIYCNNEDLEDNSFTHQILEYIHSQDKFYKEIKDICKEIINSGKEYSQKIEYLYKRSKEFLNKKKKWRNKNESCFSNIEIRVTTSRIAPLGKGGKFTGRMGNKSVVSKVVPDDEMPFTDTGKRIDVKLNLLAITNRTTGFVPHELYLTFVLDRTRERMAEMKTLKEKEDLLFQIIKDLNKHQYEAMYAHYKTLSKKEKERYIENCIVEGIHIEEVPIWEENPIFFTLYNIDKKYDWLKPYKMFQKKWGQVFPTLTDMVVGEMYMIRLKQTDDRGFSARNTGATNMKGLPERSYKNRNNTDLASDTAIRLGEFEYITLNTGLSPDEIMAFHALYRTSVKGRRDLGKSLFKNDGVLEIDDSYDSRVAQLFSVIFKSLSAEIVFENEDEMIYSIDDTIMREHVYDGETLFMTDYEFYVMKVRDEVTEKIQEIYPVLTKEELEEKVDAEMESVAALMAVQPKKKKD